MNTLRNELNNGYKIWLIISIASIILFFNSVTFAQSTETNFFTTLPTTDTSTLVKYLNKPQASYLEGPEYSLLIKPQYTYHRHTCHDVLVYLSPNNYFLSTVCKEQETWFFIYD